MSLQKDRISSGLGCILEWYDFALYGFFAPIFATLYFPNVSSTTSYIKTMGVFALGFIARPLGGIFFGYISDKYGRTITLKLTPFFISVSTFFIATIPTYNQIGFLAPTLLIIARCLQGMSIGGEFANNIVYLYETAPIKKRYFFGSLGASTGSAGILLASTISSLSYFFFSNTFLLAYGWRICFGLSLICWIIIFYMRKKINETPAYLKISKHISIRKLFDKIDSRQFFYFCKLLGICYFPATTFYFIFVFIPNYLSENFKNDSVNAFSENSLSLLARILFIPAIGFVADKIGAITLSRISCVLFLTLGIPMFHQLLEFPKNSFYIILTLALLSTIQAAILPGLLISLMKPQARSTVFSFTFNLCFGVFGGIVPSVCFILVNLTKISLMPMLYLQFTALITFITTFFLSREKIYA